MRDAFGRETDRVRNQSLPRVRQALSVIRHTEMMWGQMVLLVD
jgi:hypothetical protein